MPNTIDFTCPVCLIESLDDYNVTDECWKEAGFISQPGLKTAMADHECWKGDFTYFRNTHIDCLKARLGRRFITDDFPDVPCNIGIRETLTSGGLITMPRTSIERKLRWRMITLDMLWRQYDRVGT